MPYGIPLCSAKPMAPGVPLSGTGMTRSASTGASKARVRPTWTRVVYTDWPAMVVSGRAR